MNSHVFSAQIRPTLNRVILKILNHLALFVFSLSYHILSTSWVYLSNKIHRNHSGRKRWCFNSMWILFSKKPVRLSNRLSKHFGNTLFWALSSTFRSIIAFIVVSDSVTLLLRSGYKSFHLADDNRETQKESRWPKVI